MDKKAVLAVSFGTSYREGRTRALDVIEADLGQAFPGYEIRRAYTSAMIIRSLKERDGIFVDSVDKALSRLAQEGFNQVLVQTTHVIPGAEYHKMLGLIRPFKEQFAALACGAPLLKDPGDYQAAAEILSQELAGFRGENTNIVLMGHGSDHEANEAYQHLQDVFDRLTLTDFLVGTVEASPTIETVIRLVKERRAERIILTPFMTVAGDHAHQDMAGADEHSWQCRFEKLGYPVTCVMKGLGEYPGIRRLFISHAKQAAARLCP